MSAGADPQDRRCDRCRHVDRQPPSILMRCRHDLLRQSLPCGAMRADSGRCGPYGRLFEPREFIR
jgi:hypothetical protein